MKTLKRFFTFFTKSIFSLLMGLVIFSCSQNNDACVNLNLDSKIFKDLSEDSQNGEKLLKINITGDFIPIEKNYTFSANKSLQGERIFIYPLPAYKELSIKIELYSNGTLTYFSEPITAYLTNGKNKFKITLKKFSYDSDDTSNSDSGKSEEKTDTTAPAQVTSINSNYQSSARTITLNWNKPTETDFDHVEIYYTTKDSESSDPSEHSETTSLTDQSASYTFEDIDPAKYSYTFYIMSVDTAGNKSAPVLHEVTL